jgi:two-component system chemotaxis response regulator CheY
VASILISDDSDAIRLVLRDIVEIGKHTVVGEAIDGAETVEKYPQLKPDLLLLDLAMPKKDGLTVIQEIIAMDPTAKIILITAADNMKIIDKCLASGAKSYIAKPFEFEQVLKIIDKTLKK